MKFKTVLLISILLISTLSASENLVIVIIDGARYSETFGDEAHTYIPRMAAIAREGTLIDNFQNDSLTYTSRAVPALWCGTWTLTRDTVYQGKATQYAVKPSIFEYIRKQKDLPEAACVYVLKYISSLWLPSFDPGYGPAYWPLFHSQGNTDAEVADEAQYIMDRYYPNFLLIYLADVDGAGHSGSWEAYTKAIAGADSIVGVIWEKIKADPIYRGKTTLMVTNDHGRHDDQHGGFSGHGDGCPGCRRIMLLAAGPEIRKDHVSDIPRRIPDVAVTGAYLMGVDPEKTTGEIMSEIFTPAALPERDRGVTGFSLGGNYPNPFNSRTMISYALPAAGDLVLTVFNSAGQKIETLADTRQPPGHYRVVWDAAGAPSGIYFYRLRIGGIARTRKMLLIK